MIQPPAGSIRSPGRVVTALLAAGLVAAGGLFTGLSAQDVEARGEAAGIRPPDGYYRVLQQNPNAYQFQNVWKDVARQVRENRERLIEGDRFDELNAHFGPGGEASASVARSAQLAVSGTFDIPVLMGVFADSTHTILPANSTITDVLFADPANEWAYSANTYFDENSASMFDVQGNVLGWFAVDSASTWYVGPNDGLDPSTDHTGAFIKELLDAAEAQGHDFSQYDGDGDGEVDVLAVLFPLVGASCGGDGIWPHRWVVRAWDAFGGQRYQTDDGVTVDDYMIQPAVGGTSCFDDSEHMAPGTFIHELGHGIDLPDLYDTDSSLDGDSEGIGHWGLMGSGNHNKQPSPAHLSAWSKNDLGWVSVDTMTAPVSRTTRTLDPVQNVHQVIRVENPNFSEFFYLSNRHAIGSDQNLHGEGLTIWHVDPDLIANRRFSNTINASFPYGMALEQADGLQDLQNNNNRGDAGDVYPGSSANTVFDPGSTPSSNFHGGGSGITVDNITVNSDQSVTFDVVAQVDPEITLSPTGLSLAAREGSDAPDRTLTVENSGGGTLSWTASSDQSWLTLSSTSGSLTAGQTQDVTLSSGTSSLAAGTHTATVTVEDGSATNSPQTMTVTVDVLADPNLTGQEIADHLLGVQSLGTDAARWLDVGTNDNGQVDVGDLRAFLQAGGTPGPDAEEDDGGSPDPPDGPPDDGGGEVDDETAPDGEQGGGLR